MILPRLEELRTDHDLTQKQVAQILHCSRNAYSNYELGIRELPLIHAVTLARYYHVSLDYLVGNEENKTCIETKKRLAEH